MKRRSFLTTCAGVAGALTAAGKLAHAATPEGPFAKLPLRMAVPYGWFDGSPEERLKAAAAYGLPGIEWLGPSGDLAELRRCSDITGVAWTCIGGAGAIAPGHMVQPAEHDKTVEQFRANVERAKQLNCTRLIGLTGNQRDDATFEEQTRYVIQCLERLAPIAEENNVTIVMEALNVLVDHGGYFLTRTDHTMEILKAVDSPNVKMCFDIYHQQITEGNVIRNFQSNIDRIGHFHVGDNPGRQEPGTGELNYSNIFKAISETGYDGFVSLECGRSKGTAEAMQSTLDCFGWA